MKTNTKIWLLVFIISLAVTIFTNKYLFDAIDITANQLIFNMTTLSWTALIFTVINAVSGNILFFKFLKTQKVHTALFLSTAPLTLMFMFLIGALLTINNYNQTAVTLVKRTLQINSTNYNNYYWIAVLVIVYLFAIFLTYTVITKPVKKIEKAASRISYGGVKNKITIGGGKQFKEIEYSLNKINDSLKENNNQILETNLEYNKFVPKQLLKLFGIKSTFELELNSKISKKVTTMLCDIHVKTISKTIQDDFNNINTYVNVVSPIIRKNGGFIDKFLNEGMLVVFTKAESALICAHSIVKTINAKNAENTSTLNLEVGISIHTGDAIFGVIGSDNIKSPTLITDSVAVPIKMCEINRNYGSLVIFSKNTLSELGSQTDLKYRYIGSLAMQDSKDIFAIFESLEVYKKAKREKLEKNKVMFEDAVRAFNNEKFEQAKVQFEKVYKNEKDDKVCYFYFNKCTDQMDLPKITS